MVNLNIIDILPAIAGLVFFTIWLVRTNWAKKALLDSQPRQNTMPAYLPFIPIFFWWAASLTAVAIKKQLLPDLPEPQNILIDKLIMCTFSLLTIIFIVVLSQRYFTQGLDGLGLKIKSIPADLAIAFVNLLTVWPLILITLNLTKFLGKLIIGPQFQLEAHQELEIIKNYPQLSIKISVFVLAIVIAPILEEMIFRGLFQTAIRSYIIRPWPSIIFSSLIFISIHNNPKHWPALFVLALCLGYSYEKSGSILRPIFIHSIFNASAIITYLMLSSPG